VSGSGGVTVELLLDGCDGLSYNGDEGPAYSSCKINFSLHSLKECQVNNRTKEYSILGWLDIRP
jgi:hypothetical protein